MRRAVLKQIVRVLAAACATAWLTGLTLLGFSSWQTAAFLVTTVPLLSAPAACLVAMTGHLITQRGRQPGHEATATPVRVAVIALAGLIVALMGFVASNRLLTDEPVDPWTLSGYAISAVSAGFSMYVVWALTRTARVAAVLVRTLSRKVSALSLVAGGVSMLLVDASVLMRAHDRLHFALFVAGVFALGGGAWAGIASWTIRTLAGSLLVPTALVMALVAGADEELPYSQVARHPTSARLLLDAMRSVADADGDGFAPILGGGDCDDQDARAYPFSSIGVDCLAWRQRAVISPPRPGPRGQAAGESPASAHLDASEMPLSIVLVTLESFRCTAQGYTLSARERTCPQLARLGAEGRLRWDARTPYPATERTVDAMMTGSASVLDADSSPHSFDATWLSELRQLGYRAVAVSTAPQLLRRSAFRRAFSVVDESLAQTAQRPTATSSAQTTALALRYIEEETTRPTFLWVHYYDAHAPYVAREDQHWSGARRTNYGMEIARVDDAVAELARHLSSLPEPERRVLIVTADHGEELGDHGGSRHALTLYEEVLQVPLMVWAPLGSARRIPRSSLPGSTLDIGALLRLVAYGQAFEAKDTVVAALHATTDPQLAVIHDGMKLIYHRRYNFVELFDLDRDPLERSDLSEVQSERTRELGRLLGGALTPAPR